MSLNTKDSNIKTVKYKGVSKKHSLYSLITLLVLAFIIGNLIYNIQYLDMPSETIPLYPQVGRSESVIPEVEASGEGLRWLFIGLIATFIIIAIGGLIWSTIKGKSLLSRYELAAYLLGTVILCVLFLVLPDIMNYLRGLFGNGSSQGYTEGGGTGDATKIGFGYPIGAIILFTIAVVIVTYYIISKRAVSMYAKSSAKKLKREKDKLLRFVEDAIIDLELGGDVREVIIRCYQNLCTFIGKKGIAQKPYYTPREFERSVKRTTGLKGEDLKELTTLFEEARYSTHELTILDKDRAVERLKNFKFEIEEMRGDQKNV